MVHQLEQKQGFSIVKFAGKRKVNVLAKDFTIVKQISGIKKVGYGIIGQFHKNFGYYCVLESVIPYLLVFYYDHFKHWS